MWFACRFRSVILLPMRPETGIPEELARNLEQGELVRPLVRDGVQPGYFVTSHGRVYTTGKRPGFLNPYMGHYGCPAITLRVYGRVMSCIPIHTLVATHFIGARPDLHQCGWKDGNKWNSHVTNLYWYRQYPKDYVPHRLPTDGPPPRLEFTGDLPKDDLGRFNLTSVADSRASTGVTKASIMRKEKREALVSTVLERGEMARVVKEPGCERYYVTSHGRVISTVRGKVRILRPYPRDCGYLYVRLSSTARGADVCPEHLLHRLVLEAFVGPRPEGMQCRYLDGNLANNRLDNLRWGTSRDSELDKEARGTSRRRLEETDVIEARTTTEPGALARIARRAGVSNAAVTAARQGKSWRWLNRTVPPVSG